jgi:ribonuclease HI
MKVCRANIPNLQPWTGLKTIEIYTDGGVYDFLNLCKWAIYVPSKDHIEKGTFPGSGSYDVERAESFAILKACEYALNNLGNYTLLTDSRSVLDKIQNRVSNATKNPDIVGIKNLIKKINSNPGPCSLNLKFLRRRSNEFSKIVDDLVSNDSSF